MIIGCQIIIHVILFFVKYVCQHIDKQKLKEHVVLLLKKAKKLKYEAEFFYN